MTQTTYGKTALIAEVAANTKGYTQKQIGEILEATLNTIQQKVQSGQRVTIPGFGSWYTSQRQARMGTSIRTKQKIQIPASRSVGFTVGSQFKNAVRGRKG